MSIGKQNLYLNYLVDPGFQGVNKIFVLSVEDRPYQLEKNFWSTR